MLSLARTRAGHHHRQHMYQKLLIKRLKKNAFFAGWPRQTIYLLSDIVNNDIGRRGRKAAPARK